MWGHGGTRFFLLIRSGIVSSQKPWRDLSFERFVSQQLPKTVDRIMTAHGRLTPPPSASSLTLNVRSSRKLICVGVKSSRLHCGSHYISNVAGLPWAEVSRNGQQRLFKNVSRNAAQRGREIWICIFVRVQGFPCFLFVILFQNLTVCKSDFCSAVICIMLRLWTAERDAFAIYSYYFITVRLETASAIIALLHDNTDL